MKAILTKEQSRHLHSLGCKFPNNLPIQDNDGDYYIRVGLEDFLNGEILPKEIEDDETDWWMELSIQFSAPQQKWFVAYHAIGERGVSFVKYSEELIDALYQLACWYYGEFKK